MTGNFAIFLVTTSISAGRPPFCGGGLTPREVKLARLKPHEWRLSWLVRRLGLANHLIFAGHQPAAAACSSEQNQRSPVPLSVHSDALVIPIAG